MTPLTPEKRRVGRYSDEASDKTKLIIIKAATQEFAKHGFEGSSIRSIAKIAGTSHGLIRHHFGSKEDIFYAVIDQAIDTFGHYETKVVSKLNPEDLNNKDALIEAHKDIMRAFAQTAAKNPDTMRILLHEGIQKSDRLNYLFEGIDQLNEMNANFFDNLQAHGLLADWDSDQSFLYILMNLGVFFGLTGISSHYLGGDVLSEEMINSYTERIINLLYPTQIH